MCIAFNRSSIHMAVSALLIAAGLATGSPLFAGTERESQNMADTSDASLAASLPGDFRNGYAEVNGTRIHYVEGGKGTPVLLLPGWPQTWWEFHKIMPELAKHHRVIAVDLRGMGASAKPMSGYDKKNMAKDIHELTRALEYKQVNIAGHDIGAMVAYSFAANYPDATLKICLIDVAHPEESLYTLSLLPPPGYAVRGTGDSTHPVYLWWFAFNQLSDLPQQLLAGKSRLLIDWLFDSQLRSPAAISERDRAIYAAAYSQPDAIRAGNGWYQTFGQDIIDAKHYGRIATPVLALAGERNYPYLRELLPTQASDLRVVRVNSSSHYVPEDQPEAVVRELLGFFKS
jgi:pimeloyl-ACP methyl ester carboxylesterase